MISILLSTILSLLSLLYGGPMLMMIAFSGDDAPADTFHELCFGTFGHFSTVR